MRQIVPIEETKPLVSSDRIKERARSGFGQDEVQGIVRLEQILQKSIRRIVLDLLYESSDVLCLNAVSATIRTRQLIFQLTPVPAYSPFREQLVRFAVCDRHLEH